MKNEKIINALNKINPDIETKDKMLKNINCKIQIYRREQKEDKFMVRRIIFISVCITLICVSTAFAAYKYFTGGQVAYRLGDEKLSSAFDLNNDDFKIQSETIGDYKATLLGITSGKNISDFKSSSWDVIPERTYIVTAVEKSDGSEIDYDDEILITPLIEGLEPWKYNILTMNGGYIEQIIDGVMYRIIECDNIEYFSDRHIYLAVLNSVFYDKNAYNYDTETGLIERNKEYDKTNILFDLDMDKSKADSKKAEKYIDKAENKFSGYGKISEETE